MQTSIGGAGCHQAGSHRDAIRERLGAGSGQAVVVINQPESCMRACDEGLRVRDGLAVVVWSIEVTFIECASSLPASRSAMALSSASGLRAGAPR